MCRDFSTEGRRQSVSHVYGYTGSPLQPHSSAVLKWIADSLSAEDVEAIAYINNLPGTAGQRTALGVLGELEKRGMFSHNNVEPLIRLLSNINRHDIVKNAWMEDFKRQCAGELLVVQEVSQLVLHVAT